MVVAVSYTHLDVYKRQDKDLVQIIAHIDLCTAAAYLCARCQMALCILCKIDVYKRQLVSLFCSLM